MAKSGRRPGPTTTPEDILAAARTLFAERGYPGTSMRAVAAAAGVNPALVHHYFGTKDQLFVAALRLPVDPAAVIEALVAAGPRAEFAARLVGFFVRTWRDPVSGAALQAVLRGAVATEQGAALVRGLAENVVLVRGAAALGVTPLRMAGAMSHLIGTMLATTVIGIEPLASATDAELVELLTPAITAYLARSTP